MMQLEFYGLLVLSTGELMVRDEKVCLYTSKIVAGNCCPSDCMVVTVTILHAISELHIHTV